MSPCSRLDLTARAQESHFHGGTITEKFGIANVRGELGFRLLIQDATKAGPSRKLGNLAGALYLLLAAKIEIWEFVAAIATGLVALVGVVAVTSASKPQFKIDIRWLAQLWRLPKRVVRDCVIVIAALGS